MRTTRLKSLTLPLLALVIFNLLPQLYLRPLNYNLLCGLFIGYRLAVELLGMPAPGKLLIALAQVVCGLIIWQDYHSLFADGASGSLLTLLACLKPYELKTKRDYFVTVMLCFLVLMAYLLIDQSLLLTVFLLLDVTLLLSFMYALEREEWSWSALKQYSKPTLAMTLKSVPLLVLLFLLFPRFSTGFGAGTQPLAKTGVSDQLRPGSIAQLIQSDELVFRASYLKGTLPPSAARYWRGAVLDVSHGLSWDRTLEGERRPVVNGGPGGEAVEIHLEPGYEKFLFAPENTQLLFFADETIKVFRREAGIYEMAQPLKVRERYLIFATDEPIFLTAGDLSRYQKTDDPPTPQMQRYLMRMKGRSTFETVTNLVQGFREDRGFVYTLQPPPAETIDEFMFKTRQGFCEHYAASTATMLRWMGIPARVVTGFQGGDTSFLDNYVTVRAHDAHAWVEYFDSTSQIWKKVDPTAQVAPLRLAMGSEAFMGSTNSWLSSLVGYYKFRALIDEVDARWVGFLLRFDLARQRELLSQFGMEAAVFRALPVFLLLAIVLILAVLYFIEAQRREVLSRQDKLYRAFLKTLTKINLEKNPAEGPIDLMERIRKSRPDLVDSVEPILEPLILARFGGQEFSKAAGDDVARHLKKFRSLAK